MTENAYRRWMGLAIGTALGLAYSLVSQWVNRVALPGVPFYQPPFGPVGNTVLGAAAGGLLGLIAALPASSVVGMIVSALAGSLLVQVAVLLTGSRGVEVMTAKAAVSLCIFLPVAAIVAPLVVLSRWATNKQMDARADRLPLWRRLLLPLILVLLAGGLGMISLHRAEAREFLAEMNGIVRAAQQAPDRASLPARYQAIEDKGYPQRLQGRYTLELEWEELSRFAIPRPLDNEWEQWAVLARFESGYAFACLFAPGDDELRCRGYERWPIVE